MLGWLLFPALSLEDATSTSDDASESSQGATGEGDRQSGEHPPVALRLFSPIRSTSQEALKAEVIAAEAALAMRAEVDGLPVVYDSPAVSISLRKVDPQTLIQSGAHVEAPDGASIQIPADPRVKGRHGGPVTITVTSYHAGDSINKDMPRIKYGAEGIQFQPQESDHRSEQNASSSESRNETVNKTDRVDFFMTRTSVNWRGTIDVKVPGLAANVPAHDRPWTPFGEDERYAEDKASVRTELERLASLERSGERLRGYRKLAMQWHPDKHPPEERAKATEVFEYLQELRLALGLSTRSDES
ncbi:unnamed protein product [Durusdinium trenchii]